MQELLEKGTRLPSSCAFDSSQVDKIVVDQTSSEKELAKFVKENPKFYYYQGHEGVQILLFKTKPKFHKITEIDSFHKGAAGTLKLEDGTVLVVAIDADSAMIPLKVKI